jgi:hypothetical protein
MVFSKLRVSAQLIIEGFTLSFGFGGHGSQDAFDSSIMRC